MALFKTIYCAECGEKTALITRMKLKDGNFLCGKCNTCIPSYMYKSVLDEWTLKDFRYFKEYLKFSNQELRPIFHETDKYYSVHIDRNNRLFYLGNKIGSDTIFFQFHNVLDFGVVFDPEELKEGVLGDKVTGKVLFELDMLEPSFHHEEILADKAKAKAKKSLFGTKLTYENPDGMDAFSDLFFNMREVAFAEHWDLEEESEGENSELMQAMATFMLDSLEGVTLEDLKAQRNRLIKAFHPDKGSDADNRFAQKINNAYEILKAHVG